MNTVLLCTDRLEGSSKVQVDTVPSFLEGEPVVEITLLRFYSCYNRKIFHFAFLALKRKFFLHLFPQFVFMG